MVDPTTIDIEYCGGWNSEYRQRKKEVVAAITSTCPQAHIITYIGRRHAFEIKLDDKMIHSKLKTGQFPDVQEMLQIIQQRILFKESQQKKV